MHPAWHSGRHAGDKLAVQNRSDPYGHGYFVRGVQPFPADLHGRGFPPDTTPTWFGYSIGHWDGDAFVAETTGFNDKGWFDDPGHPHTEALRVTERFSRADFGHLNVEFTFDDPKAYTKPWSVKVPFNLLADTELIESICENEKDHAHIVGK
jgi:hypothetical protein